MADINRAQYVLAKLSSSGKTIVSSDTVDLWIESHNISGQQIVDIYAILQKNDIVILQPKELHLLIQDLQNQCEYYSSKLMSSNLDMAVEDMMRSQYWQAKEKLDKIYQD